MKPSQLLYPEQEVPEGLQSWLNCDSAITPQLKAMTGDARLDILNQIWLPSDWWMQQLLGLERGTVTFGRDIVMWSQDTACWFARTLIPQACYELQPEFFNQLRTKSMATLLYNESRVQKTNRLIYPIDRHCLEYYWLPDHLRPKQSLWMRVTQYQFLERGYLYLNELFLPGCPAWH